MWLLCLVALLLGQSHCTSNNQYNKVRRYCDLVFEPINYQDIHNPSTLNVVIGIKSFALNGHLRQSIRNTWFRRIRLAPINIIPKFLIGQSKYAADDSVLSQLKKEKEVYNDILIDRTELDVQDSYFTLTDKSLKFIHHVVIHEDHAFGDYETGQIDYIVITNDATYVDVESLSKYLLRLVNLESLYAGEVRLDPLFDHEKYDFVESPQLVSNDFYILSRDLILYLSHNVHYFETIEQREDISMSIWLMGLQVYPTHIPEVCSDIRRCTFENALTNKHDHHDYDLIAISGLRQQQSFHILDEFLSYRRVNSEDYQLWLQQYQSVLNDIKYNIELLHDDADDDDDKQQLEISHNNEMINESTTKLSDSNDNKQQHQQQQYDIVHNPILDYSKNIYVIVSGQTLYAADIFDEILRLLYPNRQLYWFIFDNPSRVIFNDTLLYDKYKSIVDYDLLLRVDETAVRPANDIEKNIFQDCFHQHSSSVQNSLSCKYDIVFITNVLERHSPDPRYEYIWRKHDNLFINQLICAIKPKSTIFVSGEAIDLKPFELYSEYVDKDMNLLLFHVSSDSKRYPVHKKLINLFKYRTDDDGGNNNDDNSSIYVCYYPMFVLERQLLTMNGKYNENNLLPRLVSHDNRPQYHDHHYWRNIVDNKKYDIAYLYQRCDRKERQDFYDLLYTRIYEINSINHSSKEKYTLHALGKCDGFNHKRMEGSPTPLSTKGNIFIAEAIDRYSDYRLVISFENTQISGYISEKMMNPVVSIAIPIYWGAPDVARYFNENSFINCNEITLEECVESVVAVLQNRTMQADMLSKGGLRDMRVWKAAYQWIQNNEISNMIRSILNIHDDRITTTAESSSIIIGSNNDIEKLTNSSINVAQTEVLGSTGAKTQHQQQYQYVVEPNNDLIYVVIGSGTLSQANIIGEVIAESYRTKQLKWYLFDDHKARSLFSNSNNSGGDNSYDKAKSALDYRLLYNINSSTGEFELLDDQSQQIFTDCINTHYHNDSANSGDNDNNNDIKNNTNSNNEDKRHTIRCKHNVLLLISVLDREIVPGYEYIWRVEDNLFINQMISLIKPVSVVMVSGEAINLSTLKLDKEYVADNMNMFLLQVISDSTRQPIYQQYLNRFKNNMSDDVIVDKNRLPSHHINSNIYVYFIPMYALMKSLFYVDGNAGIQYNEGMLMQKSKLQGQQYHNEHQYWRNIVDNKKYDIAYLYQRCDRKERQDFYDLLYSRIHEINSINHNSNEKYTLHALGKCDGFNHQRMEGSPTPLSTLGEGFLLEAITHYQEYRLVISFENTQINGYITEKLMNPVVANAIPIYWGAPDVTTYFNENGFINCNEITPEECVESVIIVMQNRTVQADMLSRGGLRDMRVWNNSFLWMHDLEFIEWFQGVLRLN